MEDVNRLKLERKVKLAQLTRKRKEIETLKKEKGNVQLIKEKILSFEKGFEEYKDANSHILPLLEDKDDDQSRLYAPKCEELEDFLRTTKDWIEGQIANIPEDGAEYKNSDDDDVQPNDSISEVNSHRSKVTRSGARSSCSSHASSASSARLRLEAERKELLVRAAFLRKKQEIEMEEARLKARKDQLELETKIAASEAQIEIYAAYEAEQDGMNEYLEKNRRSILTKKDICNVKDEDERSNLIVPAPITAQCATQTAGLIDPVPAAATEQQQQPVVFDNVCKIMHRQNDITEKLIYQQNMSQLPQRDVPVFTGDPLSYRSFIRAFEQAIETKTTSAQDRMFYLRQFTSGGPHNLVCSCEHMRADEGYAQAKGLLQQRYGDELRIATAYMKKALEWPQIKVEDRQALNAYALFLIGCRNTMNDVEFMDEMDNPSNMRAVISKLPFKMKERWRNQACEIQMKTNRRARFSDLVNFIDWQAKVCNDPLFGDILNPCFEGKEKTRLITRKTNPRTSNFVTSISQTVNGKYTQSKDNDAFHSPCIYCQRNHAFESCEKIKEQTHKDKIKFLAIKGLCFGCLVPGHRSKDCRKRMKCEECFGRHPGILHEKKEIPFSEQTDKDDRKCITVESDVTSAFVEAGSDTGAGNGEVILSIVPVKIKSKRSDKVIHVYAFLDQGSTASFCTEKVMRQLNLQGRMTEISLITMGNERKVKTHILTDLEICGLTEEEYTDLPQVYTQPSIPVKSPIVPLQRDVARWSYLKGVNIAHLDAEVGLLIGMNAYKVMEPRQIINSRGNGPYAVRTALGWVINGPLRGSTQESYSVNQILVASVEDLLTQLYNADFPERRYDDKQEMSKEDHQFLESVEQSVQLINAHYCIGLPLKEKDLKMPDNRSMAEHRLLSLKRKLYRNPNFYEQYNTFMRDLMEKGYATRVPEEQLDRHDGKVWFIPHHAVYHPKKKKLRVVFDCSASFQGVSLNSQLLQGPDLTNTLIGVLTRFRKESIGMMADIESMFYQVRVPEEDADLLRFLWWPDGNLDLEPVEYRMCVHLFGATSSPSCASYALRKTAEDGRGRAPHEAVDTILNHFYVDDCLRSVASESQAVALAKDLMLLCQQGGFHLTKWTSNSRVLLRSIPEEDRAVEVKDLDLDNDNLPMERALGVQWCTNSDTFTLKVCIPKKPFTRRGILSIMTSIYDPLGFLAPFILSAKLLLRDLCKEKRAWDEEMSEEQTRRWKRWLADVQRLSSLSITRCIKPADFGDLKLAQLHHFSDASSHGYGTVSYLLIVNETDQKTVSFMIGKSRVTPLKQVTIPRMELTAAVIAVKVDKMLKTELQLQQLQESVFWTDSVSVLKYIENDAARYKTFVANRVSLIREATTRSQWKYVNTASNPADQASRGLNADTLLHSKDWIQGPEFLLKSECEWPKQPGQFDDENEEDEEVRTSDTVCLVQTAERKDAIVRLMNYYSNWHKLKRATAWLMRLRKILLTFRLKRKELQERRQVKDHPDGTVEDEMLKYKQSFKGQILGTEDLAEAELMLIRLSQIQKYAEEMEMLEKGMGRVKRQSHIFKLDPYLEDGVLRVGGRLCKSAMPLEAKHPAILHKDDHIAKQILRYIHEETGHSGRNYILARLRQRYWIPKVSSTIRRVILECNTCRKLRAKAGEQKMANLPEERLLPDKPPFTNTGVDYFGPFEISRGRSKVKRFGVLFTCLASRAVHLEVAHSLDTSSCINAIRRFLSRRGSVIVLLSDNGTNFVGAERELREALKELNHSKVQGDMLQRGITWKFNTPAASHHGGVWERQIRTVRRVLSSLLKQQTLDEEGLQTLLCEVESILNDRPITTISDDPNDLEALTPNHLLLMKRQPNIPPGVFSKDDIYARRRWRQVQYMADLFWRRWIKEYLPLLQERQKWNVMKRNFKVGDVVFIVDPSAPRNSWLMGRIIQVMPDSKGMVRNVHVQTKTNKLVRPVTKVCLLEEAI